MAVENYVLNVLNICLSPEVSRMQFACAILCDMWLVGLYNIFPYYLTIGTIFEKNY